MAPSADPTPSADPAPPAPSDAPATPATNAAVPGATAADPSPETSPEGSATPGPVAVVCIGMAGSGKTTFMRRINAHLHAKSDPPYLINLDPAVLNVPFESNIDIRDAVNYEEVMRQYNLGPNGGILTSLNLFATKVDQVVGLLEKRDRAGRGEEGEEKKTPLQHILVDTPGQIEVFVWSASGTILLESLASSFPTVIAYIIDTPRTTSTSTFVSNMLYACSILYKTKLPMILVFNKTDVQDAEFAKEWMTDYDAFDEAHQRSEAGGGGDGQDGGQGGTYMGSLVNSMGMMLQEFYSHLSVVGVSSRLGTGVDEFFAAVHEKAAEFRRDYQPELERRKADRDTRRHQAREKELDRLMRGMSVAGEGGAVHGVGIKESEAEGDEDDDGFNEDDEDDFPDPDDLPDAPRGDEMGLQARYEDALGDAAGAGGSSLADSSFAAYLRSSSSAAQGGQ